MQKKKAHNQFRKTLPRINKSINFYEKSNAFEEFRQRKGSFYHIDILDSKPQLGMGQTLNDFSHNYNNFIEH
jgi:hypothetical protein